jgi:flavin reductase (DIM6/NTAB) family NADH-FMN oxidoreductase RutF
LTDVHVAGDHVIVIGRVVDFAGDATREPLVFHAGRYSVVRDPDERRAPASSTSLSPTCFAEGR